jgi:hypothetical protein
MNEIDAFIKSPQYQNAISNIEGGILGLENIYSFFMGKWCSERSILISWLFIIAALLFLLATSNPLFMPKFDNAMKLLNNIFGNYVYPIMKKVLAYLLGQPEIKTTVSQASQYLQFVDFSRLINVSSGTLEMTSDFFRLLSAIQDVGVLRSTVSFVCVLVSSLEAVVTCVGGVCRRRH